MAALETTMHERGAQESSPQWNMEDLILLLYHYIEEYMAHSRASLNDYLVNDWTREIIKVYNSQVHS